MIGRLRGEIADKQAPYLLLDVNGVGYELEAPMSTFFNLPNAGEQATLYTNLAIRDDAHVLYAFGTESERALFRSLLKVNGVGAKMALGIADYGFIMESGRIVLEGSSQDLKENKDVQELYLGIGQDDSATGFRLYKKRRTW